MTGIGQRQRDSGQPRALVNLQGCSVSLKQGDFLDLPVHALFDPFATTRAQLSTKFGGIKQSVHLVGKIDGIVRLCV
jgi:hypothetical protein